MHSPQALSEPVAIYQFDDVQQAVLLLDEEKETWFMYYRAYDDRYGVKLAPVQKTHMTPTSTQ